MTASRALSSNPTWSFQRSSFSGSITRTPTQTDKTIANPKRSYSGRSRLALDLGDLALIVVIEGGGFNGERYVRHLGEPLGNTRSLELPNPV